MQREARVGVVNPSPGGGGNNGVETTSLKLKQQQQDSLQAQKTQIGMSADLCIHFVGDGLARITAASATYPPDCVRKRLAARVGSYALCKIFSLL
ncbi:hypothetical protein V6N13_122025 [Hibiscus sabdariffa]|uniref:Uncharacterized protein n=1 Tax=Hibiscus sabdariffa TaxID=183260 RepID=A0ABR2C6N4_9ROSI